MRKEYFNKIKCDFGISMINCGYEDCCPGFICPPHIRNYFLIHYITNGNGIYEVNSKRHNVKQGDIFIIYPYETVSYYSPNIKDTWSFCWMGITGSCAESYLKSCGITKHNYVYNINHPKFTVEILKCLDYIELTDNNPSQLKLNSYIMECLSALEKQNSPQKNIQPSSYVDKSIQYIEYNYMNGITVKDVIDYIKLDRTYFYRIFKKYTGTSPENYIIKYRIKKAMELIEQNKYTLSQIANFVGINELSYFSRLFKREMGISPTRYNQTIFRNIE